jgi:hypothetical protein
VQHIPSGGHSDVPLVKFPRQKCKQGDSFYPRVFLRRNSGGSLTGCYNFAIPRNPVNSSGISTDYPAHPFFPHEINRQENPLSIDPAHFASK